MYNGHLNLRSPTSPSPIQPSEWKGTVESAPDASRLPSACSHLLGFNPSSLRWSKSKRSSELRVFFLFYCQLITRNKPDKPRGKLGQHSNVKSEHTSMTVRNKDVYNKQAFNYFMRNHYLIN